MEPPARFWQWNPYSPVRETNAAMRDGDWKLVRPQIDLAFATADDTEAARRYIDLDIRYKYDAGSVTGIAEWDEPARRTPEAPAPQLFNLAEDPGEENDLATREPRRASAMLGKLESWFEEVEAERRSIPGSRLHPRPVSARFS